MKLLLDENLSPRLCRLLQQDFEEVRHVRDYALVSSEDGSIWDLARSRGFLIVTRDRDFFEMALAHGAPPQVAWLRLHNGSTRQYADLLLWFRETLMEFERDANRTYCILPPESLP